MTLCKDYDKARNLYQELLENNSVSSHIKGICYNNIVINNYFEKKEVYETGLQESMTEAGVNINMIKQTGEAFQEVTSQSFEYLRKSICCFEQLLTSEFETEQHGVYTEEEFQNLTEL